VTVKRLDLRRRQASAVMHLVQMFDSTVYAPAYFAKEGNVRSATLVKDSPPRMKPLPYHQWRRQDRVLALDYPDANPPHRW
jgi:hypothetical protein